MPNVNITIPTPLIVPPAKFKTRYRELPSGTYSSNVDRDNTMFTLSLTEGDYEMEIIYVNPDGLECDATYERWTVKPEAPGFECVEFSAEIIQETNGLFYLVITYTPPATNPQCGWRIQHSASTTTIPYSTLPASGEIKIQLPQNNGSYVKITALLCNEVRVCYEADVPPVVVPPCVPAYGAVFTIREQLNNITGRCDYFLDVTFNQSIPASPQMRLQYLQSSLPPVPDQFTGFIPVPTGSTPAASVFFTRKLNPKFFNLHECTTYTFSLTDQCNNSQTNQQDWCRSICFHETP